MDSGKRKSKGKSVKQRKLELQKVVDRVNSKSLHYQANPDQYPQNEQFRVGYLVSVNELLKATVAPVRMAANARGMPCGEARIFDYWKIKKGYSQQFIGDSDFPILEKLNRLRGSRWNELPIELADNENCLDIFIAALLTKRALLDIECGKNLVLDKILAGKFSWSKSTGGKNLILNGNAGRNFTVLPFDPMWYIDNESGATGILNIELPAKSALPKIVRPLKKRKIEETTRAWNPSIARTQSNKNVDTSVNPIPHLTFSSSKLRKSISSNLAAKDREEIIVPFVKLDFKYNDVLVGPYSEDAVVFGKNNRIRRKFLKETSYWREIDHVLRVSEYFFDKNFRKYLKYQQHSLNSVVYLPVEAIGGKVERRKLSNNDIFVDRALHLTKFTEKKFSGLGYIVKFDEDWPFHLADSEFSLDASVQKSKGERFELTLNLRYEGRSISFLHIIEKIISRLPLDKFGEMPKRFSIEEFLRDNRSYCQVADDRFVLFPNERLAPIVNAVIEWHAASGFHPAEAAEFSKFADVLENCGVKWRRDGELRRLGRKFSQLRDSEEINPPPKIRAILRPYQKTGYNWLRILSETGFGGVLADDMGLGKTIQALCIIAHKHLEAESNRPSLLLVPTSLVGNWVNEINNFLPELKAIALHGPERKTLFDTIPDHHLVLSTYPLVRRDHEELFSREYELAILDEAQAVKNSNSVVAGLIREIKARQRIALTGTPVENNLGELWSLFDWLNPGLLGNKSEFRRHFRTPIERHGAEIRQRQLAARVNPFLLRRTKQEVASELPPLSEINEIVTLEGGQRDFYDSLVVAMNVRVSAAIASRGFQRSRITILDALLKLRQVCCDPSLVKLDAAKKILQSAKRERLFELLEELIAEQRKVLVFSQFVEMLNIIRKEIEARGWKYAMLTGSTKNRTDVVEKFQNGDASIFLISIKAGGVGLNLTAADTVVIYDPWWNPAVEKQAIDRAHRIGQEKPVFVYKLIAEGTVEFAIQEMKAKKKALADSLYKGSGDISILNENDISELFKPISEFESTLETTDQLESKDGANVI